MSCLGSLLWIGDNTDHMRKGALTAAVVLAGIATEIERLFFKMNFLAIDALGVWG